MKPVNTNEESIKQLQSTLIFNKNKIANQPYNCLSDFFDSYELPGAVSMLNHIIKAAASDKPWKKNSPYEVICFMERLDELCSAAFLIIASNSETESFILENNQAEHDIFSHQNKTFVSGNRFATAWNCFPRNLNIYQFKNPYKALKVFAKHKTQQEWHDLFRSLVGYALSKTIIDGEYGAYEIIMAQKHLLRLIEGCHLIEVRLYKAG